MLVFSLIHKYGNLESTSDFLVTGGTSNRAVLSFQEEFRRIVKLVEQGVLIQLNKNEYLLNNLVILL